MQLVPSKVDYRLKLVLQKIAGVLPYGFYRFIVERHPKLLNADYDKMIRYYIKNCDYVRPYGLNLRNKVIVETGTGAALADPITFYLAGAAKIHTFDIRLHVNPTHVWGIIDHYENHLEYLSRVMGVPLGEIQARWEILRDIRQSQDTRKVQRTTPNRYYPETKSFQDFLKSTQIHIYEGKTIPKRIEENSIDIFFSNSVLQRPHYKYLQKMIHDANRVVKLDGIFWHKIDCRDINWLYDKGISEYHYLKYSDSFLKLISSESYSNQNRIRQCDFLRLFKEVGLEPIFLRSQRPENYREQLGTLKVNTRFRGYSLEDLAVTNFIIYAGRSQVVQRITPKYELHEFPARVENQFL